MKKKYSKYYKYYQKQFTDDLGNWKWVEIAPELYYELRKNPNYNKNDFSKNRQSLNPQLQKLKI